jgi:hypothetical protein
MLNTKAGWTFAVASKQLESLFPARTRAATLVPPEPKPDASLT